MLLFSVIVCYHADITPKGEPLMKKLSTMILALVLVLTCAFTCAAAEMTGFAAGEFDEVKYILNPVSPFGAGTSGTFC